MFKFLAICLCGGLIFLAGCATSPQGNEPLPTVWTIPNAAPVPAPAPVRVPVQPVPRAAVPPALPPKAAPSAPNLKWTSLNRWAAEMRLPAPRRLSSSPVVTYSVSSPSGVMELEIGSREATWRGLEMRLGFPPELIDDQVFVYGLDLQKNLEPLLVGEPLTFGPRRVIVIDPGHGGINSGTKSAADGRLEKEFTLDWAKRLAPLLTASGWTVWLTRTNDVDITLASRVAFAEAQHADLFLSLHFNSAALDWRQSGFEIYCLTPTGLPSTLTRGYRDMWTDQFPNNAFDAENLQLAVRLQAALLQAGVEADRGTRRARFMGVLLGQKRPAVLIEGGFLSNPEEAKKIASPAFRQKLAEAIANALK